LPVVEESVVQPGSRKTNKTRTQMRTTIVEKRARYKTIDWYLLQNLMSLMYFAMTLEHLFFDFLEATEKYMSPWCRVAHRNTQCSSVNVI
tara:strand:+ start:255 stop:524 length:270 start_codon:yes stop_codon:yes gene_type:complete